MRFSTLSQWLDWQQTLHPQEIDLGLERVAEVAGRLGLLHPNALVISVAGTNGKGSSLAMLESIFCTAGYTVGKYTSPHLLHYNERICINQTMITDQTLCAIFERVDVARNDISLSYFEFSTLAALLVFSDARLDIVLLEVGLGGRLDAVNIIDADIALVTNVDLDHQAWLGNDVETIAIEKAGIFRPKKPAVCAQPHPPRSLKKRAHALGALWCEADVDFNYTKLEKGWLWSSATNNMTLPLPALDGDFQLQNAAAVVQVLQLIKQDYPVANADLRSGLETVQLAGRLQSIAGDIECILDVAHNPHAARALVNALPEKTGRARYLLVLGMLEDKAVEEVATILATLSQQYYIGGISSKRGLDAKTMASRIEKKLDGLSIQCHDDIELAFLAAKYQAKIGDTILVCGSFMTVASVLRVLQQESNGNE